MSTLTPKAPADHGHPPNPAPPRRNLVPVAPLRDAFERGDTSASTIAAEIGWMEPHDASRRHQRGDARRLKRTLGIHPDITTIRGKRYNSHRQWINRKTATLLCRALGVDPIDVPGL